MSSIINIRTRASQPFIVLPTLLNNRGPFDFVLDTGAAMTILSEQTAGPVGIRGTESREALGSTGKKLILCSPGSIQ